MDMTNDRGGEARRTHRVWLLMVVVVVVMVMVVMVVMVVVVMMIRDHDKDLSPQVCDCGRTSSPRSPPPPHRAFAPGLVLARSCKRSNHSKRYSIITVVLGKSTTLLLTLDSGRNGSLARSTNTISRFYIRERRIR